MPEQKWSRDWQYALDVDGEEFTPSPIQFANCDRIEANGAVYIFDEVGSGKTISAGLMTIHYLYNHPGQNALVITTNALAKKREDGGDCLFLQDWRKRLSLKELHLEDRITVINNHPSKIKEPQTYGLIVIDEAQEFLHDWTGRYHALTAPCKSAVFSQTERVVFLTATPIRENSDDLIKYQKIAAELLPDYDVSQNENILSGLTSQIINGEFDSRFPATRYFKDHVAALSVSSGSSGNTDNNHNPKRRVELWKWNSRDGKRAGLLAEMQEALKKERDSRFVIFVRFVEDEAEALEDYFQKSGYFQKDEVKAVTGKDSRELSNYSNTTRDNLPKVLILTYQIAEAGVNLPGYNYVVNYHISRYPSALEQRFGRVDRLTSAYGEIHACYMLCESMLEDIKPEDLNSLWSYWDTNTLNFCHAVTTYMDSLLPSLPSRNALLNEQSLTIYEKLKKPLTACLQAIKDMADRDEAFQIYRNHIADSQAPVCDEFRPLIEFCDEYLGDEKQSMEKFRGAVANAVKKLKEQIAWEHTEMQAEMVRQPDRIFYRQNGGADTKPESIPMQESVRRTASNWNYRHYRDRFALEIGCVEYFRENVKKCREIFEEHRTEFNEYFCQKFREKEFSSIFPRLKDIKQDETRARVLFYYKILKQDLGWGQYSCFGDMIREEIGVQYLNDMIDSLEFFQMCRKFWNKLKEYTVLKARPDNPFERAYEDAEVKTLRDNLGLSEDSDTFSVKEVGYNCGVPAIEASAWYKLAAEFFIKEADGYDIHHCFFRGDDTTARTWCEDRLPWTEEYPVTEVDVWTETIVNGCKNT